MDKNDFNKEKIQQELEEVMKKNFGDDIQILTNLDSLPGMNIADPSNVEEISKDESEEIQFHMKPKEVKDYLDQYVIGQDEAKKVLSVAICDHFNSISHDDPELEYKKQNVLLIGPTGVGKTYLIKTIAKLIGVPFLKADSTKFTETGYVGSNVDDMVRDLVQMADGNIQKAEKGIIYLDEVDKIAGNTISVSSGRDVSGRGVQYNLLKLMEESEVDMKSPHDMMSQFQSLMDFQKTGKGQRKIVNTKKILFIVSGAFSNLEPVVKRRLNESKIGFVSTDLKNAKGHWTEHVSTDDLIQFGFEPEFVGRMPVRTSCLPLSVKQLKTILKESKGSVLKQYVADFAHYGIEVTFEESALDSIAKLAHKENIGARGLQSVLEKTFREYKFELPSSNITHLTVTKAIVNHPERELKKLLG